MAIHNRLQKNYKHLAKYMRKNAITAWRLYDRDIPEYPYIADIYDDYCIIQKKLTKIDFEDKKIDNFKEFCASLSDLGFSENRQIIKERKSQKKGEQYEKSDKSALWKIVTEGELKFHVNLTQYLDTGLFIDHRLLRKKLHSKNLKSQKYLNLFSYTGALSVAAASAGATLTSVDLSNTYSDWARQNFELNDLGDKHEFITADCLTYIKDLPKASFDGIIIDPPTYSVSKKFKGTFDIERDHHFLLRTAHELLRPGATGYFSTNLRSFKIESELADKLNIKDTSFQTIDKDFHDKKIHSSFSWTKE